jgi:hypothetical protein
MEQFQFGGEEHSETVGGPEFTYCGFGSYRVPALRSADSTTSEVVIWDETGEIRFTVADVLTEPKLVWDSASQLQPSDAGILKVAPDSLTWEERPYLDVSGDEDGADWGTQAYPNGSQLSFSVPATAPVGTAEIRVRYDWHPQLVAPVLECNGAKECSAGVRLAETATLPITILPTE